MNTLMLSAQDPATAPTAAELIMAGELVALPTETVYGLGADGLNPDAVAKIFLAKGRPQDNPLILHIAQAEDMDKYCHSIPASARALAKKFWPGPLTMVLPARDIVPKCTTAGLPTVAVRCPDCEVTREIIRLAGVPIAAPSANISGKPSTTTAQHVLHDHDGRIAAIVDGGPCRVGVESTIIDLTDKRPRLLRPGGITPHQLMAVVGDLVIDKAVTDSIDQDAVVKAPGMKYRHYAPECDVVIVDGSTEAAARYIKKHYQPGNRVLCFVEELDAFASFCPIAYGKEADEDSLMAGLFAALRELDDPAIGTVFARRPSGSGKALAVQNRLMKAAGFRTVDAEPKGFILGITGGTGCGKTTLLKAFEGVGGLVMDCDAVYHKLLLQDTSLLAAIEDRFPGCVASGELDRKRLGAIVFSDPAALADLNAITHGAVKKEILRQLKNTPVGIPVAIDAIGLFEGGLTALCDATVAVTAPLHDRVQRLITRDNITEEQAQLRINAQKPEAWFREKCDYILENNGTAIDFQEKCLAFFENLSIIKKKA
ncbi:MAG: threonylcarbamoyl-AMP synthase [Oscillospiraceae bacterium]|nr:threonylcarbamoyl-AMP synthase [Oscillospiraceae bacterium]